MKQYLIIGFILAVFALLWFTRNIDAEVINKPTEAQNTITSIATDGNGCTRYNEDHAIGKDLQTVTEVVCK